MHSLLEQYLSEVAAHLSALPAKRRNEELREMRAHLENAVIVNRELGQSEDEAAQSAVAQFGTPKDLSENVVWAWRRGAAQDRRSFWGASLTTPIVLCLLSFVMNQRAFDLLLDSFLPHNFLLFLGKHPGYGMDFTRALFLATFGLSGLAAGLFFPKRAVRGACLGLVLFWIGFAMVDGVGQLWSLTSVEGLTHQGRGGWILMAIASAWAGSRWRLTQGKRRRLALR